MKKNYIYILLVIAALIMIPILSMFNMGIPCIFHEITGLYCPGCGLTRAAIALMRLDFKSAFGYNAVGIILIPFICIFYIVLKYKSIKDPKFDRSKYAFIWYIILAILIIFGILRNIPAFSFLAP